ncbi:helix-turn-helix domain-containing protein [Deinococcus sp. QL22]|uniref:helix-turn-helix domain-containing protein n=1 Tax=Deinococcus sp. QL22 TaxID=2939437 RepID=UPI002016EFB9|nr:helix-turn-helix domain-containing protein [Deinococcus sp. QL22]UQN09234.1 excisionase family DNA-binding protein [Deinococcus sp. QL22]
MALPPADELELQEAALLLQVSPDEITRLIEEDSLPHHQVGAKWVVYREDVLAYQDWASPVDRTEETESDSDGHVEHR